jgi:phosphinothricin acetyltransferase
MNYQIDTMQPEDWAQVSAIYAESIETGVATFETEVPSWESWDSSRLPTCRLVARRGAGVLAWAALSPASST